MGAVLNMHTQETPGNPTITHLPTISYPVQLPTCQQSHARTITHLPTISCPHHHLPRPLIKSSAYPVQLPTCQQSHAPTTTLTPTHPDCHPPAPPQPPPTATHLRAQLQQPI